jgi:hypothetical protein
MPLSKAPFARQLAGFVFDYLFGVKPRSMGPEDEQEVVERGFARFKRNSSHIDEPLALIALRCYFDSQTDWTTHYFVQDGLKDANPQKRGEAFEILAAYSLAKAFASPRRLSEVFQFLDDNDLKNATGQLVSIEKTDGTFAYLPVDISSNEGPSYTLGCTASTEEETLSRFKDPRRTALLFLAQTIGPDVVLFFKLPDGTLLRVVMQLKHRTASSIGPAQTQDAFRTTDPKTFNTRQQPKEAAAQRYALSFSLFVKFSCSDHSAGRDFYIHNPELNHELQKALEDLGPCSPNAGTLGVLRVLCSYPAEPHLDTLKQMVKDDEDKHPGATLDLEALLEGSTMGDTLKSLRPASLAHRKRSLTVDGVMMTTKR